MRPFDNFDDRASGATAFLVFNSDRYSISVYRRTKILSAHEDVVFSFLGDYKTTSTSDGLESSNDQAKVFWDGKPPTTDTVDPASIFELYEYILEIFVVLLRDVERLGELFRSERTCSFFPKEPDDLTSRLIPSGLSGHGPGSPRLSCRLPLGPLVVGGVLLRRFPGSLPPLGFPTGPSAPGCQSGLASSISMMGIPSSMS